MDSDITEQGLREYVGKRVKAVSRSRAVTDILQYDSDDSGFFVGSYRLADGDLLFTDPDMSFMFFRRCFLVSLRDNNE